MEQGKRGTGAERLKAERRTGRERVKIRKNEEVLGSLFKIVKLSVY